MKSQQELLSTPAPLTLEFSLWKYVAAGAIFAPFAALLAFRPDCGDSPEIPRPVIFCVSIIAGAVVSLFCAAMVKMYVPNGRSPGQLIIRGSLGMAGILLAAAAVEAGWWVAGAPSATVSDTLQFFPLLAYYNSFALLYLDWRQKRRNAAFAQSSLRSLQAQLQPHFFFNTLNTVSAFIPEQPEAAQAVLGQLATLFRQVLASPQDSLLPLHDELEIARQYLEIERARFGQRLRYVLPSVSPTANLRIPALTLQPIIENAVRHGISRLPEGGEIHVEIAEQPTQVEITVSNPVEEPRDVRLEHLLQPGHSLRILSDRLNLFYRGKARLTATLENGFRLTLRLPKDTPPCAR